MGQLITILLGFFTFACTAYAQVPDIVFSQEGIIPLKKYNGNYYEITAQPMPFTLLFNGTELHVCAGLDDALFQAAKPDTDINKDFTSPFSIFKYAAMSEKGDYLYLYKEAANSLNQSHGAKPVKGGHQYTVSSIMHMDRQELLGQFRHLYLALWLDQNKDQYIDENEFLRVKINIEDN